MYTDSCTNCGSMFLENVFAVAGLVSVSSSGFFAEVHQ